MRDKAGLSEWTFDALNRIVTQTPPNASVNTCSSPNDAGIVDSYDENSNLIPLCSANGTTNYGYDSNGKLPTTPHQLSRSRWPTPPLTPASPSTVQLPAEIQANDQILVTVTTYSASTITMPTGYTLVTSSTVGTLLEAVYSKTASSSDTSVLIGAPSNSQVTTAVYRGVSTSTPIDAVNSATTSSPSTSLTVPGITTTAASATSWCSRWPAAPCSARPTPSTP